MQSNITHLQHILNLPALLAPSAVHDPTTSLRYSATLKMLRPDVTLWSSSLKFTNRLTAIVVPPSLEQTSACIVTMSDYLTFLTNSPKSHILLSLHSSFTSN